LSPSVSRTRNLRVLSALWCPAPKRTLSPFFRVRQMLVPDPPVASPVPPIAWIALIAVFRVDALLVR
jgi:hypothetical protein